MTYGITGISPLGTIGLGAAGSYVGYDMYMPSSYGMGMMGMSGMPGITGDLTSNLGAYAMGNPYGMSGAYGMGGMMQYYNMMQEMQNKVEENKLQHTSNMHTLTKNAEVKAHDESISAMYKTLMADGAVQQGVFSLRAMIKKGDNDGICQEYDKLQKNIYTTFAKEFESRKDVQNPADTCRQIIEALYGNLVSAREGGTHDLRTDIQAVSDGALENGFMNGYRLDHHQKYVDQAINHIYGERIDHRADKDFQKNVGRGVGYGARFGTKLVEGAAVGAGIYGIGIGAMKLIKASCPEKWVKNAAGETKSVMKYLSSFSMKNLGRTALIAGAALAIGDIIWRATRSSNKESDSTEEVSKAA